MTQYVQTLNLWGENFWAFAWPMLWQSSLMIAIIFAFDTLFARRIRAAVRYALWMVVLVKLLLPPALALPTGAAWWLLPAKPAPALTPVFKNEVVTYDTSVNELASSAPQTIPFVPLPPPELSGAGWAILGCGAVSAMLLFWLVFRWMRVAAKVRRAHASSDFAPALQDTGEFGRMRYCPRLKLVDDVQSPALYGLFRPVILLPRSLTNQLSARQLRAVLLHEVIHLRRGDVWVNCAQTLLQIAYWWHPLIWLANARIRRVREEAVDDAVMLALRHDADAYAPTLLEVAKFALRRPFASLGLVGILESRSALRQRVERLMDFRPPRKAGVTFLSLCGIFAFCAVALPMGQGPATGLTTAVAGTNPGKGTDQLDLIRKSQALYRKLNGIHSDVSYTNASLDDVLRDLTEKARENDPDTQGISFVFQPEASGRPEPLGSFSDRVMPPNVRVTLTLKNTSLASISEAISRHCDLNYMVTDKGVLFSDGPRCEMRTFKVGTNVFLTNLRELAAAPIPTSETYVTAFLEQLFEGAGVHLFPPESVFFSRHLGGDLIVNAPASDMGVIERIVEILHEPGGGENRWLESINHPTYLNRLADDPDVPSDAVTPVNNSASQEAIYRKLNRIQLSVSINGETLSEVLHQLGHESRALDPNKQGINFLFNTNTETVINPNTGYPEKANGAYPIVDASEITISLNLKKVTLRDVLDAICAGSDHPIKYSVRDYGVVFSMNYTNSLQCEVRAYKVDPDTFYSNLKSKVGYNGPPNEIPQHVSALAKEYFSRLGVNLDSPKSVVYKGRLGVLRVYATAQNLDVIDKAMRALSGDPRSGNSSRPQSIDDQAASVSAAGADFKNVLPDPATDAKIPGPPASSSVTAAKLERRVYSVETAVFVENVRKVTGETDPLAGFRKLAANAGVDLSGPKAVFTADNRFGILRVRATEYDLDIINGILSDLRCSPPPMVHIKARFIEVPKEYFSTVVANSSFPGLTNGGVLTNPEYRYFLQEAESQAGTEELAEPECTTISTRQTKIQATKLEEVVTNYLAQPHIPDGWTISPQMTQLATGPTLDTIPCAIDDGSSIFVFATAELTEFLGYASPEGLPISYATNSAGEKVQLPISLPAIQLIRAQEGKMVPDGHTLVLVLEPAQLLLAGSDKKRQEIITRHIQECEEKPYVEYGGKVIIAFVTATLIDAAGNPIHHYDNSRFAPVYQPVPAITNWAGNLRGTAP